MRRYLTVVILALIYSGTARAQGLLVPVDRSLPPLALVRHKVRITIEDQVAVTRIEQTFRNGSNRPLEATYVFPLPKGASVTRFSMWVDGKETTGELLDAARAREVYTGIVRRTQDPGLLEYIGNDLVRLRVFPVPARGDKKVSLQYSAISQKDNGAVEYLYPLRTAPGVTSALEDFSIEGTIKSQDGVANVFSPTHAITVRRASDREIGFTFDHNQGSLNKDFQLFYSAGHRQVGLTVLAHRPVDAEDGYIALLISPGFEASAGRHVPRDMVLVLDTSGSMRGAKMDQARRALKYCLDNLGSGDRFGLINFATTVNRYREDLSEVSPERTRDAKRWVDALDATGGTAIDDALTSALAFRSRDAGRVFTIVFFTDGEPTVGETNPTKILQNVAAKNSASTRIFTFGVGDDVNATLLDQLADDTRAVSTYVRPAEDIEAKVSGLYARICNPVLTNLKLTTSGDLTLREVYPPTLPDLFQGSQLIVIGRYRGQGVATIHLSGQVAVARESNPEHKDFVYELTLSRTTGGDHSFLEHLWARRKVGYLLDQIRANGEKKELVDEAVALAKHYGIATPYTSYLIVPDGPVPIVPMPRPGPRPRPVPLGGGPGQGGAPIGPALRGPVAAFARQVMQNPGDLESNRGTYAEKSLAAGVAATPGALDKKVLEEARSKKAAYDSARDALMARRPEAVQAGKLGVDLSVQTRCLRNQSRLEQSAVRNVLGRNLLEIAGVWIDEGFDAKMPALTVKAQSDAYFRILERHPGVKDFYSLGNHVVWVTPCGTALVIDSAEGKESLSDAEIDRLFTAR